jgi:hypothetical protein
MTTGLKPCLLLLTALAMQACAGSTASSGDFPGTGGAVSTGTGGSTSSGTGGGSGVHCTTTACVSALSDHLTWDVEITPPGTSGAALTELVDIDLAAAPLTLTADLLDAVATTFTVPANATAPSIANVVLTVPSSIPGRPDLTNQAPAIVSTGLTSAVTVPHLLIGIAGTLVLSPLPPADQQSPPYSFPVTLASTVQVSLPTDNLSINGTLTTALNTAPMSTFVARAFQNGTQVSNAALTAAPSPGSSAASFQLLVQSTAAANSAPIAVQLTPQTSQTDPWYVSTPIWPPFPTTLDPIMLPAYGNLNQFNVTVYGPAGKTDPVNGALVQMQAVLGTSSSGSTEFARSSPTNAQGIALLSLVPGSAQAALDYAAVVVPPAGSRYATTCITSVAVTAGTSVNTPSAFNLPPIILPNRPVLSGTVTDSHGYPVANINITATPGPAPTCGSTPPAAGNTITAANGGFSLPLDPGTYQLDYDPPAGSAAPRLTELAVSVLAGGQNAHYVSLPMGGLVTGTVVGPDRQTPLPSATVRLFEPRCSGQNCTGPMRTPPWLRGQTVTDANGQFRVVVPLPN